MANIELTGPRDDLKQGWRQLYNGYATFYKREMTDDIAENVWRWLNDPTHEVNGIIALADGKPAGLAHFRRMPSPLRGEDVGFLDDLFVNPELRGMGIAQALFEQLREEAKARNWALVRWLTADDNYRARGLYDTLSKKTLWNTYEMVI